MMGNDDDDTKYNNISDELIRCPQCRRNFRGGKFRHRWDPKRQTKYCAECRDRNNRNSRNCQARKVYEWKLKNHYKKIAQDYRYLKCPDCDIPFVYRPLMFYRKDGNYRKRLREFRSIAAMDREKHNYIALCQDCYRHKKLVDHGKFW